MLRLLLLAAVIAAGCDDSRRPRRDGGTDGAAPPRDAADRDAPPWNPDAACARATSDAEVAVRPVDIIWVVDNSTSMEPAIRQVQSGLNDFAGRIASSGLDFRVLMLSLRGTSASDRFPVCIPQPLAGDSSCGDGERFFHVSVDIRSTQPIEQILGTLAQSDGYADGDSRGSAPWRDLLRGDATKTMVVVTDDNQRTCDRPCPSCECQPSDPALTPTSLENFPGGGNPFNGDQLGPGILSDTYGSLFEGYTFNAIYGWGDERDPDVVCIYPDDSEADAAGHTYTALVERTGGVRAQICDQASSAAWDSFFDAVATTVEDTARIECEIPLPAPPDGMMLNPSQVNVLFEADGDAQPFFRVEGPDSCGPVGGWHYDDEANPSQVILCPASCTQAQNAVRDTGAAGVSVAFGCQSVFI
ncbi:MAG: hypothetical protein AAGE52_26445 [Myxococcota bacterium]